MTTNFHLRFQNSKKLVIGGVKDVYMKNLGCSPTCAIWNLEFIMVQMHLNVSDYSLKFHVSELPKLLYTAASLLTLNLRIFI